MMDFMTLKKHSKLLADIDRKGDGHVFKGDCSHPVSKYG